MLVVEKDFNQQVGGTLLSFPSGKVIRDEGLEKILIATGAPVRKIAHQSDLLQCPHCAKLFTVKQALEGEDEEEE